MRKFKEKKFLWFMSGAPAFFNGTFYITFFTLFISVDVVKKQEDV